MTQKTEREWAEMIADSYDVPEDRWPQFANEVAVRLAEVRHQEREACAEIADNHECGGEDDIMCQHQNCGLMIAVAIRSRKDD